MATIRRAFVWSLLAASVGLALGACADDKARFVGFNSCDKFGVSVWYIYPNAQGSYDGANVNPENCIKK
ncbi:MAG: hypothetical protein HYR63_02440 [Proteobacteria bacterium]|nr:hypothetical protein [Pseudomonadota bacterium]MBI3498412.1 hypothetical protein [Pseudomonadota bacterium]